MYRFVLNSYESATAGYMCFTSLFIYKNKEGFDQYTVKQQCHPADSFNEILLNGRQKIELFTINILQLSLSF